MPKMQCTVKGKKGIKWGEHGTCYVGKDKEAKMNAQRKAIEISKRERLGRKS